MLWLLNPLVHSIVFWARTQPRTWQAAWLIFLTMGLQKWLRNGICPPRTQKPKSKDRICCLLFLSPTRCFRPLVHVQLVYFARWGARPRSLSNWEIVFRRRPKSSTLLHAYGSHVFCGEIQNMLDKAFSLLLNVTDCLRVMVKTMK